MIKKIRLLRYMGEGRKTLSKVRLDDIGFFDRYVSVEMFGDVSEEEVIKNLKLVYHFIDETEGGDPVFFLGTAYRKIKKIAREKYCRKKKYIISKRQVANLIKVHDDKQIKIFKIPYTADYIFKAIFYILEEYKANDIEIPAEIAEFLGKCRRDCFYKAQSDSLKRVCNVDSPRLRRYLNQDLNSDEGALGKIF